VTEHAGAALPATEPAPTVSPDVSVIIAVYNTMPYLTRCLKSLVNQTIGIARMEVVAVDDGSTDGSGAELDRFASEYPGVVRVIHQPNSGGPAVPSNRGLDAATGRYVFFIGADDYLGPQALERLVAAADTYESDVVAGRMVGVNGRYAHQAIFHGNQVSIDLFDSSLPYHLSNTKLFRRDLLDKHQIRYPEDMPVGSDQPFTFEACLRANRISVLSDYRFYYSVRRRNALNITYASDEVARLACTARIMDFIANLVEPGPRRDAIFVRHFEWELSKLVEDRFLDQTPEAQEQVRAGVARLADVYLTDPIRGRLRPESLVRLAVARSGTREQLVAVIRQDATDGIPPTVVDAGRSYAAYPGFRDPAAGLPDSCFEVTPVAAEWAEKVDLVLTARTRLLSDLLIMTVHGAPPGSADLPRRPLTIRAGSVGGRMTATDAAGGVVGSVAFHVAALAEKKGPLYVWSGDETSGARETPVRASRLSGRRRVWCVTSHGVYRATLTKSERGQLMLQGERMGPRKFVSRLRGWLRGWLRRMAKGSR
jgi:glycosyltransferase involved in cell wall biosynthesis